MKRLTFALIAVVMLLLGYSLTAHAANALDPQDGGLDLARAVYAAVTGGHYAYAAALALIAATALTRKAGGSRWPWMHTDAGSATLVLLGSFGTSMAAALAGGGAITVHMVEASGFVAFGAMGGYAALKKFAVDPYLVPWESRAPSWLRPILTAVVWWFQHKSDPGNTQDIAAVSKP